MKFLHKIDMINAVFQAIVFQRRTPLLVSWEITRKCNTRCKYCTIWDNPPEELDTEEVFSIIRELSLLGTRMIHFTGGEALLRSDFCHILRYCHERDILTSLNSNGALVPARIEDLATLQILAISIDGSEEVHDSVRGQGSFRKAIDALRVAKDRGMQTRLLTVLSKQNLDSVDFLLEKAMEFNAPVVFQPATELLLGGQGLNPMAPEVRRYRQTIEELIVKKRGRQSRYIANSVSGLKFLHDWPDMKQILCLARLVSCRIESDGSVLICFRNLTKKLGPGLGRESMKDAFGRLPSVYCNQCCCAPSAELNCLLSLKLDTIFNIWRYLLYRWLFSGPRRVIRYD